MNERECPKIRLRNAPGQRSGRKNTSRKYPRTAGGRTRVIVNRDSPINAQRLFEKTIHPAKGRLKNDRMVAVDKDRATVTKSAE